MIISAGEVGTGGIGNHKHNDILSFELQVNGEDFIVDPGTYVYTPDSEMRNLFRSTAYHNTIRIDGQEINEIRPKELFRMYEKANPKVLEWRTNENQDIFEAEHYGYQRLPDPVIHKRRIVYDKNKNQWLINDFLSGRAEHLVEIYFHLAPQIRVEKISENEFKLIGQKKELLFRAAISENPRNNPRESAIYTKNLSCEIIDGWYSPSYGLKEKSQMIVFYGKIVLPLKLNFLICPI
jgi:uncharacterized heparinase superfamily protein